MKRKGVWVQAPEQGPNPEWGDVRENERRGPDLKWENEKTEKDVWGLTGQLILPWVKQVKGREGARTRCYPNVPTPDTMENVSFRLFISRLSLVNTHSPGREAHLRQEHFIGRRGRGRSAHDCYPGGENPAAGSLEARRQHKPTWEGAKLELRSQRSWERWGTLVIREHQRQSGPESQHWGSTRMATLEAMCAA